MRFLLAEILDFQGSAHIIGVGSLSSLLFILIWFIPPIQSCIFTSQPVIRPLPAAHLVAVCISEQLPCGITTRSFIQLYYRLTYFSSYFSPFSFADFSKFSMYFLASFIKLTAIITITAPIGNAATILTD